MSRSRAGISDSTSSPWAMVRPSRISRAARSLSTWIQWSSPGSAAKAATIRSSMVCQRDCPRLVPQWVASSATVSTVSIAPHFLVRPASFRCLHAAAAHEGRGGRQQHDGADPDEGEADRALEEDHEIAARQRERAAEGLREQRPEDIAEDGQRRVAIGRLQQVAEDPEEDEAVDVEEGRTHRVDADAGKGEHEDVEPVIGHAQQPYPQTDE